MKNPKIMRLMALLLLAFIYTHNSLGQAILVLNGAKINIANGALLVLENPSPAAITYKSGYIISEGQQNLIRWNLSNNVGLYTIPFGSATADYLPLTFTKTAGTGAGYFSFSTYPTNWQNSGSLPAGVTNLLGNTSDNSAFVLDRFWQIDAKNYSVNPALSNLTFTYADAELTAPNTISESMLSAQRWNESSKSWSRSLGNAEIQPNQNTVKLQSVAATEMSGWWALVDQSSPLPVELLSFDVHKTGNIVKLNWVTASEINFSDFEIQRSADAENFNTIFKQKAIGNHQNYYEYNDNFPHYGTSYYRLKQNDMDGSFSYSPIRAVSLNKVASISVYPNPSKTKVLQIVLNQASDGNYAVSLSDLKGTNVFSTGIKIDRANALINFPEFIKPGVYLLSLQSQSFKTQLKIVFN